MIIDKELIKKVALNARLNLSDEEVDGFILDFEEVLNTFAILEEVDTNNVESSFHPIPLSDEWREDEVSGCLSQEEALSNTVHKKDGYFKGPKSL